MPLTAQINAYIDAQAEPKRTDMRALHDRILSLMPGSQLWYLDGLNAEKKVIANPNIGYGCRQIVYADGSTKDFYKVGLSANTTGISVYLMGLDDKTYLTRTYGHELGKASITGYCIKFKALSQINQAVLEAAIIDVAGR